MSDVQSRQYKYVSEWLKKNNNSEVEKSIIKNKNLVNNLISKYSKYNSNLYETLQNEGMLGLMLGMAKYNQIKGADIKTYVYYWIKSKITRFLQKNSELRMQSMNKLICQKGDNQITLNEIASEKSDNLIISDVNKVVTKLFSELPNMQYIVLKNRYLTYPRATCGEIANKLNYSRQYIKVIEKKGLDNIRKYITQHNIKLQSISLDS